MAHHRTSRVIASGGIAALGFVVGAAVRAGRAGRQHAGAGPPDIDNARFFKELAATRCAMRASPATRARA